MQKPARVPDGCSCSTELLLQLLSKLTCQTPWKGQTKQARLSQQKEAASIHSEKPATFLSSNKSPVLCTERFPLSRGEQRFCLMVTHRDELRFSSTFWLPATELL